MLFHIYFITQPSCFHLSRPTMSSAQNNPFPEKGHSCPLKPLLCNRSCVQYRCREIIPYPEALHIVSYVSPPFLSNSCLFYHHFSGFTTLFSDFCIRLAFMTYILHVCSLDVIDQPGDRRRSSTNAFWLSPSSPISSRSNCIRLSSKLRCRAACSAIRS